jgi:tripartite-type tricarboxylate transporter receptor subunit TctC
MFRSRAIAVAAVSAVLITVGHAYAADPYFKGKTVNLIVGFEAGGGVDLTARTFAEYLGKFVPGNPTFVVQNMPGASSMKAHNFIYEAAKADGLNLLYSPWFPVTQILSQPGANFKYQGYALVGAFRSSGFLIYARNDIVPGGVTRSADILKAPSLKFAGQNPFNTYDLLGRLSLELLNVRYSYVTGYRGAAGIRASLMKNETNIGVDSVSGYRSGIEDTMVKTGMVRPMWAFHELGPDGKWIKNPHLPEAPSITEVYRDAYGKEPSGIEWDTLDLAVKFYASIAQLVAAPPKTPAAAVDDLSKGFYATMDDKAFQAEFTKRFGYAALPTKREDARKTMDALKDIEPRLVARFKAHIESGEKVSQ